LLCASATVFLFHRSLRCTRKSRRTSQSNVVKPSNILLLFLGRRSLTKAEGISREVQPAEGFRASTMRDKAVTKATEQYWDLEKSKDSSVTNEEVLFYYKLFPAYHSTLLSLLNSLSSATLISPWRNCCIIQKLNYTNLFTVPYNVWAIRLGLYIDFSPPPCPPQGLLSHFMYIGFLDHVENCPKVIPRCSNMAQLWKMYVAQNTV